VATGGAGGLTAGAGGATAAAAGAAAGGVERTAAAGLSVGTLAAGGRAAGAARSTGGADTAGALGLGVGVTLVSGARIFDGGGSATRPVSCGVATAGAGGLRVSTVGGAGAAGRGSSTGRAVGCAVGEPAGDRSASTPHTTATEANVASAAPPTITAARLRRGAGPWAPVHSILSTSPISGRASACL